MPLEAVKIPADVQIEEKIIGPISLRQIMILMATGGASYVVWGIAKQAGYTSTAATIMCWTPLMVGAAFAFVKINDISLMRLVLLQIERMDKPMRRTFGPRKGISVHIRTGKVEESPETKEDTKKNEPNQNLQQLSALLDNGLTEVNAEDVSIEPLNAQSQIDSVVAIEEEHTDVSDADDTLQVDSSEQVFHDIVPPQS